MRATTRQTTGRTVMRRARSRAAGRTWTTLLGVALLTACAHPPVSSPTSANTETDDDAPPPQTQGYSLDLEGEAPPPDDVVFEEDALVPPEEIDSASLSRSPVEAETAEDLPPPDERLEPSVDVPAEPSVEVPAEPSVDEPVPQSEASGQRGFRVQLMAAGSRTDAERIAREARARLTVSVYVDFESPYFKVRAGDFTDRAKALELRDRARANGYSEAWVVTTTVKAATGG